MLGVVAGKMLGKALCHFLGDFVKESQVRWVLLAASGIGNQRFEVEASRLRGPARFFEQVKARGGEFLVMRQNVGGERVEFAGGDVSLPGFLAEFGYLIFPA